MNECSGDQGERGWLCEGLGAQASRGQWGLSSLEDTDPLKGCWFLSSGQLYHAEIQAQDIPEKSEMQIFM